jgi:hypothetical protein
MTLRVASGSTTMKSHSDQGYCTHVNMTETSNEVPEEPNEMPEEWPKRVHYDYIKSNQFRVLHADGAWGGLTSGGYINMNFYAERPPIPRQTSHDLSPDGSLQEIEELRNVRDAFAIREIEASIIMHPNAAARLRDWLDAKIREWDEIRRRVRTIDAESETNVGPDDDSESE